MGVNMIVFEHKGDFKNTDRFLRRMTKADFASILQRVGKRGVSALAAATPIDSSLAANSWGYETRRSRGSFEINWTNSDIENGFPVVIGIQYGHGTGTGGYVQGRDFINPAMRPIFEQILADLWTEVTTA
jgi:hypothetical protein